MTSNMTILSSASSFSLTQTYIGMSIWATCCIVKFEGNHW